MKRRARLFGMSLIAGVAGVIGASFSRRTLDASRNLNRPPTANLPAPAEISTTLGALPPNLEASGYNAPMLRTFEQEPLSTADELEPLFVSRGLNLMALDNEPRSDATGTPGAPVWLDERNEWQVQGIVRHAEGTIRLSNGVLLVSRSGMRGLIRRRRWSRTDQVPVGKLRSVRVTGRSRGRHVLDMEMRESSAESGVVNLKNCRPISALRALAGQIELANDAVKVEWSNLPPE